MAVGFGHGGLSAWELDCHGSVGLRIAGQRPDSVAHGRAAFPGRDEVSRLTLPTFAQTVAYVDSVR
jgi:hypothetical protein